MEDNVDVRRLMDYSRFTQLLNLCNSLKAMQKNNQLCDISIKVGDMTFHAHRVILAATSEYFTTMFTSGFQESMEREIEISGNPEAFKVLLEYLYTEDLNLPKTPVLAMEVMKLAHYLQLDYVFKRCQTILCHVVSTASSGDPCTFVSEVVQILRETDVYGLTELKKACKVCLAKNVKHLKSSEMCLSDMTYDLMAEVLDHKDLEVGCEKEVRTVLM